MAVFPAGQAIAAIDGFFNVESERTHFFNDGQVDGMVFCALPILFLFFCKNRICERLVSRSSG
jgi:hypothetical protein